ncbi:MAG: nitroreductase [Chitinophagaceae bacterium]|nr:nitroreductase [Chitinophagaceae bacterium]
MNRKKFLTIAGIAVAAGGAYYISTDKSNFTRADIKGTPAEKFPLLPDERTILYLASLAPSGHNTQPWLVKYIKPFHWIVGTDKNKWLPAVDPNQRETILSIGAFIQTLEYAAGSLGYNCQFNVIAATNQDENIIEVQLVKAARVVKYDTQKIKNRRTVRSGYLADPFKKEIVDFMRNGEPDYFHFFPNTAKEHLWLNEQTIEANRIQSYRDAAQSELANWIRFSRKDAAQHLDGLTLASMEVEGIPAWYLRNFYDKKDVMKKSFREQSIEKVVQQVSKSAGWLLITSKDNSIATLLETGKKMQRLFLKVRDKGIAIHPMTQVLEEATTSRVLNQSIGISDNVQFILRTGYVKNYPLPVSLRRPVDWFVHT